MKFVRYGPSGEERPGVLDAEGRVRCLAEHIADFGPNTLGTDAFSRLRDMAVDALPVVGDSETIRLGSCVSRPGKIACFGLNEKEHATQMKMPVQSEPALFFKPGTTLNGPTDDIVYPRVGKALDWEAEVAIVIGRGGKYIAPEEAARAIAGLCIINEVSDRHWQFERGGQASKGKSFDTFAPLGPWLVPIADLSDPNALAIRTWVNGVQRQSFSSADYIWNVFDLTAYCSQLFTLEPGDVIAMGSGPGNAHHTGAYLQPGDLVEVKIDGLGAQKNRVIAEA
jgi:2-keto-4-pentenoate hydratase/2-oxohepta-3-ene-1,7-dioic acid hydratase in catechol pathway